MNVFKRIKAWLTRGKTTVPSTEILGGIDRSSPQLWRSRLDEKIIVPYEKNAYNSWTPTQYENISPAMRSFKERDEQLSKLRGEFESLSLSIILAKRQKRKTSHLVRELSNVQAQIIKLEVGR